MLRNSNNKLSGNHDPMFVQFEHTEGDQPRVIAEKVLVVEDESINQFVVKKLLEAKGYQVDIADTGQTALRLYQANAYAAILMDLGLPDLSGVEVSRRIRKLEQINGKHIPIIAFTANDLSARNECLAAGMDDFATKPFEIDPLIRLLKAWLGNNQQTAGK